MIKIISYSFLLMLTIIWYSPAIGSDKNKLPEPEDCKSYISIHGSSNVNQFRFYNENPKINASPANPSRNNHIQIPVMEFEASNDRMLRDFHEMVNASQYPYINIAIEPRTLADFDETSGMTNFRTNVTIAGKSNDYIVPSLISGCEQRGYILQGDLEVKLTDFDIEPPTKVFGAVKVNDNVFIKFAFRFQPEEALTEQVQD